MQVHLVLPGLLWPSKALYDTASDLELPALSRLLGRGRITWQPPLPTETWLCREFRILADEPPAAALRLLGEGGNPGSGFWLCADSSHLRFEQGRLTLAGGRLGVGEREMRQVAEAVSAHLAAYLPGFAEFIAGKESGWGHAYLRMKSAPQITTTPLSAVVGRNIQSALPRGPEAPFWLRLANELQMLLHALSLNREREALDLASLNTLWFWGAGTLPVRSADAENHYDAIATDNALLTGISAWAGISRLALPGSAGELPRSGRTLLFEEELLLPAQEMDALAWRNSLARIERDWLAPLAAALASGGIESLRLSALGEEAGFELRVGRRDLMKFWRRPVALHRLAPP